MRNFICTLLFAGAALAQSPNLGIFTNSGEIGSPAIKGAAEFSNGEYRITGSGANMWAKQDQLEYVWKEVPGNFTATATVKFLGTGAEHRKAGIVLRQSLDADAPYADVVIHGNGMPALQWRPRQGEDTNTFDLPFDGPATYNIKMVRNGVRVYLYLGKNGAEPKEMFHTEVTLRNPVLVGLGVCSHDAAAKDTVVFSGVSVEPLATPAPAVKPPA